MDLRSEADEGVFVMADDEEHLTGRRCIDSGVAAHSIAEGALVNIWNSSLAQFDSGAVGRLGYHID